MFVTAKDKEGFIRQLEVAARVAMADSKTPGELQQARARMSYAVQSLDAALRNAEEVKS